jgi:hypothetical protein
MIEWITQIQFQRPIGETSLGKFRTERAFADRTTAFVFRITIQKPSATAFITKCAVELVLINLDVDWKRIFGMAE